MIKLEQALAAEKRLGMTNCKAAYSRMKTCHLDKMDPNAHPSEILRALDSRAEKA